MEIKPREVIVSLIIIAGMMIFGIGFSNRIRENLLERYQEYDTAIKLDSEELFRYGMRTDIGRAFVYGELKTLDPVTFSEIGGTYSHIRKEEQEYRMHTKTVTKTYTDDDGHTHTDTEIEEYWTWDTMRTEERTATKISFLNVEFSYGKIPFPIDHQIAMLKTGYHKRNVYYGSGTQFQGTIYTILKENTINQTKFYEGQTITEIIEFLESGYELVIFWIFWILLTAGCVVGFYFLENRWLD